MMKKTERSVTFATPEWLLLGMDSLTLKTGWNMTESSHVHIHIYHIHRLSAWNEFDAEQGSYFD